MGNILCCVDHRQHHDFSHEDLKSESYQSQVVVKTVYNQSYQAKQEEVGIEDEMGKEKVEKQLGSAEVDDLVDDHLSEFEYDGNSDEEIEEFEQKRNENEKDIRFSKKGFIEYIDKKLEFTTTEEEAKFWELKLNKEDVKVFIRKGGSELNAEQPYIKTEVLFNSYFEMNKILKAIFKESIRQKWDKNVLKFEVTPLTQKNTFINYQLNKSPLNFANRDFVDKQVAFSSKGKFYSYYSSIPNDTEIKEVPQKVERASTLIGIQRMERRPEDGKIVYTMLFQSDLKMKITPKLISMFLPAGLQDWSRKCNKYLNDNYDKI